MKFSFGPNEDVHTSLEAGFLKFITPQDEDHTTLSSSAPQSIISSLANEDEHTSLETGFLKLTLPHEEAHTTVFSLAPAVATTSSPAGINKKMDVLCGRSKLSHTNEGNIKYRAILKNHSEAYNTAHSRGNQKSVITRAIISDIQQRGGRFLIFDKTTNEFVDAEDAYVYDKVGKALRSAKKGPMKIKKPRLAQIHVPTPKDDAAFEDAVADQQRIFQALVEREAKGNTTITLDDWSLIREGLP